ncbi:hypothetical protein HZH66_013300 [Vespula vulgaris]|uniref:Uncharacterized protein n=1 Tax=Vespula vulgaris TaxID=7454 RepID=A0A834J731_VESVU|nr:hypothetical protein HZH66_013300 [Vespula vulgaris]
MLMLIIRSILTKISLRLKIFLSFESPESNLYISARVDITFIQNIEPALFFLYKTTGVSVLLDLLQQTVLNNYHLWYGNGKYAYSIDSNGHLVSLITDITLQRTSFLWDKFGPYSLGTQFKEFPNS